MAASETKTPARARKRKGQRAAPAKCLAGDGKRAHARGLCNACYVEAKRRVESGETTWEELEKAGLARPTSGNRSSKTAIAKKIASLKSRNGRR